MVALANLIGTINPQLVDIRTLVENAPIVGSEKFVEYIDQTMQMQSEAAQRQSELDTTKQTLDNIKTERGMVTDEEKLRVQMEYDLFEKKHFIRVLQFLIYFVDTLRANDIVWGVGRGSSVASFCLFLIGVHKINPLLYNLDITEFLR